MLGVTRMPIIFAHGQGLISVLALTVLSGVAAVILFIVGLTIRLEKTDKSKDIAKRLFFIAVACILLVFIWPAIVEILHLP